MSLHYLLDGYNIINQIPKLARKKLEVSREGLVRFLETFRPQGSFKNSVTVVFDGKSGVWSPGLRSSIKVIFSQDESADDKIKRMVATSTRKKSIVVVTDDRDIVYSVRAQGAKVLGVQDFFAKSKKEKITTRKQKSQIEVPEGKRISKTLEQKITSEFEKIWLKEKA